MTRTRLRRAGRWAPVMLAGALISCPCDDDEESVTCWCAPEVASIEIVPKQFEVQPGSRFQLRARLLTADNVEIPEFFSYRPYWTVKGANLTVLSHEGHTVVLEVPSSISSMGTPFEVFAAAGSSHVPSDAANGVVVPSAPTAVDHIVADPHSSGAPLSVALAADGTPFLTDWNVTPVAFSGFASLGNLQVPGGGGVMVFSSDHAMAYLEHSTSSIWNPGSKRFSYVADAAAPQQAPSDPLIKQIRLWIHADAVNPWPVTTVEAIARNQLADANEIFLKNRAGVQFELKEVYSITRGAPSESEIHCSWTHEVEGVTSGGLRGKFNPADPTDPAVDNTNAIDVFIIEMGSIRTGWACREGNPDTSIGYRIFLSATIIVPRVLGHELGHTLLTTIGDTDHGNAADIGPTNLMIETCPINDADDCDQAPRRSHISIGQACEMNKSAIVSVLRGSVTPNPLPVPRRCPPIKKDIQ